MESVQGHHKDCGWRAHKPAVLESAWPVIGMQRGTSVALTPLSPVLVVEGDALCQTIDQCRKSDVSV